MGKDELAKLSGRPQHSPYRLGRMYAFRVFVPFEPVYQEDLWSRVITELPDTDLPDGIRLRREETGYGTEVDVRSEDPSTAKQEAIRLVEDFLTVLAAWNCAFQVRIGGVRSEIIERPVGIIFGESHVEAIARRGDLKTESALYRRREQLPQYVRNCLDLNYLLVLSARPANRWLLAATGLEALAVGNLGNQATVSERLTKAERRTVRADLQLVLAGAGLGDFNERIVDRLFSTTEGRVADHIFDFLACIGIDVVPADEINRWWRGRGTLAHGGPVEIDRGSLQQLVDIFQKALRRTAGAEPIPKDG